MQTVTSTLADAIEASVRRPIVRVLVDWDRSGSFTDLAIKDISADVVDLRLSRELSTDLPEQAKLFAGSAAAETTVTLRHRPPAGSPEQHGAWYYSALNTASPLYAYDRMGAPCTVEVGFVTEAGREYIQIMAGTVRSLEPVASGQRATLRIADGADTMRSQTRLPPVIADGATAASILRPGLNITFLADWVLRSNGYYASPPQRSGCKFLATLHGSGWPEVGTIEEHHGDTGSKLSYSPTPTFPGPARWVQAINTDGSSGQAMRYFLGAAGNPVSPNNTRTVLVQGWWKFNLTSSPKPLWILFDTVATSGAFVSMFWEHSGGTLQVLFNRGGSDPTNRAIVGPVVSPGTTDYHYYAVLVSFTSTGVSATFRYDNTTTGPTTTATPSVTNGPEFTRFQINRGRVGAYADARTNGVTEDVQVTTESSVTTWDDGFTPTAEVHASDMIDNRLVASPIVQAEGWALLQDMAKADFSTAQFTEAGLAAWWPRDRWTTAPYTTSQATLRAARELKELATVEAVDQVRNRIIIRAQVPSISAVKTVWKLGAVTSVAASSTKTIHANLGQPVGNVDTAVVFGTALGSSRYLAGTRSDGQGTSVSNLAFTIAQLDPQTIRIQIDNPNAFRVYLTGDENDSVLYSGKPYLWLDAQLIEFEADTDGATGGTRAEAYDPASRARFSERLLEVPDSDLRQDDDDTQTLADDLLADLADPKPAITDVPIVADPRLQLGDRVTITDPDGLAFTDQFHLSKTDLEVVPGEGMTMVISARGA